MFAALKAVSEAVLRATSPEELFQRVAAAAVHRGAIGCAGVLLADPDKRLRLVACAGAGLDRLRALQLPVDAGSSDGGGAALHFSVASSTRRFTSVSMPTMMSSPTPNCLSRSR